jgi:hypothetical protein
VSRFPFGDDSKKSKKNERNGKDEEQIKGSFTAFRMTTKNKGNGGAGSEPSGLRWWFTNVGEGWNGSGVLTTTNPEAYSWR